MRGLFFIAASILIETLSAWADSEIAVAIRYLQAAGESHAQIYLYREDGKLIRQLTNDKTGQNMTPVFAPDGTSIVWIHSTGTSQEYWSIEPKGTNRKQIARPPAWYTAPASPQFTFPDGSQSYTDQSFTTPDGKQELILTIAKDNQDDEVSGPGHGQHYTLGLIGSGSSVALGTLPGYEGLDGPMKVSGATSIFLIEPPLRVAFFTMHQGSTDRFGTFALDLANPRLVRLGPNPAMPIPLPGEAAFLTITQNLYVPLPGTQKSVNCDYLEHWDAELQKIRYAKEGPAICYGFSMYRPGLTPSTITIPSAGP